MKGFYETTKATQQKLDKQQAEKRMQLQSLFAEKSACRFAYMNTNEYLSTACVASSSAVLQHTELYLPWKIDQLYFNPEQN